MKKLFVFFFVPALMLCLLNGCMPINGAADSVQPKTGGTNLNAQNINMKDIDIIEKNGSAVLTFSLISGSRTAGYAESKLTTLPPYKVEILEQPQRLVISFEGISFWDYEKPVSLPMPDFLLGLFQEVPADNDSLIIYVQLSKNAAFDVSEQEGTLTVTLTPGDENSDTKYYCVSNSFYQHQEGKWPDTVDMKPVLCSDLQNRLLISKPFDTREEAQNYLDSISETVKTALPEAVLSVIGVTKNALPDFLSDIDDSKAESNTVLMSGGKGIDTPVLLKNGRYLDTAPDGSVAFSREYKPDRPALEQDAYMMSEMLWMLDAEGRAKSIDASEFFFIKKAKFSFDGRYLAILDSSVENSVLYVYDFQKGTLINLGEEGFGSQTADFAWSDTDDTIFAMTGNDDIKQMRSCRFSEDGSFAFQSVEEREGADGSVAIWNGRLLFADKTAGIVYEIGETRKELTKGVDICTSADTENVLVLETSPSEEERVPTSLKLYNMNTGETVYLTRNTDVVDFGFLPGGKVCFLDAKAEGTDERYPYGLFVYDMTSGSSKQAAVCGTDVFATSASDMLYFVDYLGDVDNGFYATYQYRFDLK